MNWYVDPAAIGTGTGLDWDNALISTSLITTTLGVVAYDHVYCRGSETLTAAVDMSTNGLSAIAVAFLACNASGVCDGLSTYTIDHGGNAYSFNWRTYKTLGGIEHINVGGVYNTNVAAISSTLYNCRLYDTQRNQFSNCVFKYCEFDKVTSYEAIYGGTNRIDRCVFKDCTKGIYTGNGYNLVTNSVFINCVTGIDAPNHNADISNNVFYLCTIGIDTDHSSMIATYNRFIECTLGIKTTKGPVVMRNNGFFGCTTKTEATGTGSFIDVGGGVTELTTNGVVDAENYDFTTVPDSELTMIETDIGGDAAPGTTDYLSCGLTPECSGGSGSGARSRFGEILGIKRGIY